MMDAERLPLIIFFSILTYCFAESIASTNVCVVDYHQEYDYVIRIDPTTKSNGDGDCNPKDFSTEMDCPDINTAFKFHRNSTAYVFATGSDITHYLKEDSNTFFTEVSDIAFIGNSTTDSAQIECSLGAGLGFWNADRIRIQNIEFSYCGVLRVSTSRNFSKTEFSLIPFKVGLFFYNCTDVSFCRVTVQHGPDSLGVCMYDVDGTVNVYDSDFHNNSFLNDSGGGGGGFIVAFTYCIPANQTCNAARHQSSHNKDSNYTFYHSNFQYNRAKASQTSRVLHKRIGQGVGGGLAVFFRSNASNNSIEVIDCRFKENRAYFGGGLYVAFEDNSIGNEVKIERAIFENNECNQPHTFGAGGGMRITSLLDFGSNSDTPFWQKSLKGNSISIVTSHFVHNRALRGGGLSFSPAYQRSKLATSLKIMNCTFRENIGRTGAAIQLKFRPIYFTGIIKPVSIENSTIQNNTINFAPRNSNYDVGLGVIYSIRIPLIFRSNLSFSDNYGTAIAIVGESVDFCNSNMSFENNIGDTGGALALLENSHAIVDNDTRMFFAHNSAHEGGAIYNLYRAQGVLKDYFLCFIQYKDPFIPEQDWGASFTFFNNTSTGPVREPLYSNKTSSGVSASSIFSTSVYPCALGSIDKNTPLNRSLLFCINPHWTFIDGDCTDEITTQGDEYKFTNTSQIESYPGKAFILPITVLDDLDHNITTLTSYTSKIHPVNGTEVARVDPAYSILSGNYLVITGMQNTTITLELESIDSRPHVLQIKIYLQACPTGFHFRTPNLEITNPSRMNAVSRGVCYCRDSSFLNKLNCSLLTYEAHIPCNYWIGVDPTGLRKGKLVMGQLPNLYSEIYFNNDNTCKLPKLCSELDEAVCGIRNRTGPLCGKCKEGFATAINSYDYVCTPCNEKTNLVKNIALYVILAYVPYILFFMAIIFFNLKLTSSAVSGFILFAQMLSIEMFVVDGSASSHFDTTNLRKAYLFVYGTFNLVSYADMMEPFCISTSLNTLDVLCLEYTLAGLPLLIILMIYFVMELKRIKCFCFKRRPNRRDAVSSGSHLGFNSGGRSHRNSQLLLALSSFILLSYAKFSFVSMRILATHKFFDENGTTLNDGRVSLAGHLSFISKEFLLPYGMIAILIMIIFVLLPPLFLLGLPQLIDRLLDNEKFSCFKRIWPTLSIHAFLDAFQGYHKPNRRIFVGLYFIFRLSVIASYVTIQDHFSRFIIQQILIAIMIALLAIFKPYKREVFNFVDILIFLNLAIINSISVNIHGYSLYGRHQSLENEVFMGLYLTQYCFIWLPLVCMLAYIPYKLMEKTGLYRFLKIKVMRRKSLHYTGNSAGNSWDESQSDEDLMSDTVLFKRAEGGNRFRSAVHCIDKQKVHTTLVGVLDEQEEVNH